MSHLENQELLKALNDCTAACNHCAASCLAESDVKMMAGCIRSDWDCATICSLTAQFVARGSVHTKQLLELCIAICEVCAEECEKHAEHAEHCKACAEACRKCAEACKAAL